MIRTLRLTSLLAGALLIVLVGFSAVYGIQRDPDIAKLAAEPGVIERFKASLGSRAGAADKGGESPLVTEARRFANYLNPPASIVAAEPPRLKPGALSPPKGPGVSPKFNLVATTYNATDPNRSMALIDQPGEGLMWVRQGRRIDRQTLQEVRDGAVVVFNGVSTYDLSVPKVERVSLVVDPNNPRRAPRPSVAGRGGSSPVHVTADPSFRPTPLTRTPDEARRLGEVLSRMQDLQKRAVIDPVENNPEVVRQVVEQLRAEFDATRITSGEANALGDLGQALSTQAGEEIAQP